MLLIKIKAIFKLMRWFHELVVILPFVALYGVIEYYSGQNIGRCHQSLSGFVLLCVCVQCHIAAGCVLNDIVDRDIDKVNKPLTRVVGNTISLKGARIIFTVLTFIIILLSAYISFYVFSEWAYISPAVYAVSLLYDFYFKRSPLLGNILMAALTAFIPLVILFFAGDCIEILNNERITRLIYLYAAFPFLIIIPRELSLDISDIEGDKACGCRTLPIVIGAKKAKQVVVALVLLIIGLSVSLATNYGYLRIITCFTDVMLVIYLLKLRQAETRIQYIRIGRFLWFIMISGLVGLTFSTILL